MSTTRILLATVIALTLASPAQALDEAAGEIFSQCLDAWPGDPAKQVDCFSEGMDRTVEARGSENYEGLTPREFHEKRMETLMDSLEQLIKREQLMVREPFLDSPPLRCVDPGSETAVTRQACDTKELNLADAPPVQAQ